MKRSSTPIVHRVLAEGNHTIEGNTDKGRLAMDSTAVLLSKLKSLYVSGSTRKTPLVGLPKQLC
jgi:hypothetical protein